MKYLRPSPPRPSGGHHQHAPTDYRPSTLHPRPTRSPPRSVPSLTGAPLREVSGYLATKRGTSRRNTRRFPIIVGHIVGIPKMPLATSTSQTQETKPARVCRLFLLLLGRTTQSQPPAPSRASRASEAHATRGWCGTRGRASSISVLDFASTLVTYRPGRRAAVPDP